MVKNSQGLGTANPSALFQRNLATLRYSKICLRHQLRLLHHVAPQNTEQCFRVAAAASVAHTRKPDCDRNNLVLLQQACPLLISPLSLSFSLSLSHFSSVEGLMGHFIKSGTGE